MASVLDLTGISSEEMVAKISESVGGLGANEKLDVTSNSDLSKAAQELLDSMKGECLWAPYLAGPDSWKGVVYKNADHSLHDSIIGYMTYDHKRCDDLYADAEAAWQDGNKEDAAELLKAFDLGMARHLGSEENILFPAFTEATGMVGGPVQVMTMEHEQMRGVLKQMMDAIGSNDLDNAFAAGDTMVILMQQHNVKEEGILYPMIEQHTEGEMGDIVRRLQNYMPS